MEGPRDSREKEKSAPGAFQPWTSLTLLPEGVRMSSAGEEGSPTEVDYHRPVQDLYRERHEREAMGHYLRMSGRHPDPRSPSHPPYVPPRRVVRATPQDIPPEVVSGSIYPSLGPRDLGKLRGVSNAFRTPLSGEQQMDQIALALKRREGVEALSRLSVLDLRFVGTRLVAPLLGASLSLCGGSLYHLPHQERGSRLKRYSFEVPGAPRASYSMDYERSMDKDYEDDGEHVWLMRETMTEVDEIGEGGTKAWQSYVYQTIWLHFYADGTMSFQVKVARRTPVERWDDRSLVVIVREKDWASPPLDDLLDASSLSRESVRAFRLTLLRSLALFAGSLERELGVQIVLYRSIYEERKGKKEKVGREQVELSSLLSETRSSSHSIPHS